MKTLRIIGMMAVIGLVASVWGCDDSDDEKKPHKQPECTDDSCNPEVNPWQKPECTDPNGCNENKDPENEVSVGVVTAETSDSYCDKLLTCQDELPDLSLGIDKQYCKAEFLTTIVCADAREQVVKCQTDLSCSDILAARKNPDKFCLTDNESYQSCRVENLKKTCEPKNVKALCDGASAHFVCLDGVWTSESCGDGELCMDGKCVERCNASDKNRCDGRSAYMVCTNSYWTSIDCLPNEVCSGGVCTPSSNFSPCEEQGALACADSHRYMKCLSGAWQVYPCGEGETCSKGVCR